MRRAVSRDLMYPQTMGTISRSSFICLGQYLLLPSGNGTYESGIKVRSIIWISTLDVSEATREGILEEVEHGKELSRGPVTCQYQYKRGCLHRLT